MSYAKARERLGREAANAYWRMTERYVDRMEELAGDALRRVGSLRLADDEELDDLRAEYEALREDGLEAESLDQLEPPLDRLYRGAIRHPRDGSLQPARWVRRLGLGPSPRGQKSWKRAWSILSTTWTPTGS
jgi:glycine/D-amino acid oxidase-like deaminating enzyme